MKEKPVNTPIRKNTRKMLKQHAIDMDMTIVDYLDHVLFDHWKKVDELKAMKRRREDDDDGKIPSERAANAYAEVSLAARLESEAEEDAN